MTYKETGRYCTNAYNKKFPILHKEGEPNNFKISRPPDPNFCLTMGDDGCDLTFSFRVKKTLKNRIKYGLFCQFFPFRITKWD